MNAVRSSVHVASSAFLILYGLFVLPWIEATYFSVLPFLFAVLVILLIGRQGRTQGKSIAVDLMFLAVGIAVLFRLSLWFDLSDEGLTRFEADGDPYFFAAITGAVIVLLELMRRSFGWLGFSLVVALAAAIALVTAPQGWEVREEVVQASISGMFDSELLHATLVFFPVQLTAALITLRLLIWSRLPTHFAAAASWMFRGSPFGPIYLSLIVVTIVGGMTGGAFQGALLAAIFLVPLFRELKYPNEWTAAFVLISAYISKITPPVLSASGFTLADITGISYLTIIVAVFFPALAVIIGVGMIIRSDPQTALASAEAKVEPITLVVGLKSTALVALFLLLTFTPLISFAIDRSLAWLPWATVGIGLFAILMGAGRKLLNAEISLSNTCADIGSKASSVILVLLLLGVSLVAFQATSTTEIASSDLLLAGIRSFTELDTKISFVLASMLTLLTTGLAWVSSLPMLTIAIAALQPSAESVGLSLAQYGIFLLFMTAYAVVLLPGALVPIAVAKLADANIFGSAVKSYRWLAPTLIVPIAIAFDPSLLVVREATSGTSVDFFWVFVRLILSIQLLATVVSGRDRTVLGPLDRLVRLLLAGALFGTDLGVQISVFVFGLAWMLYHHRNSRLVALPRSG